MNGLSSDFCRAVLQTGVSVLAQSTLLLALGLTAAWLLRRRGPALRAFVLQVSLAGVALGALASVTTAGRFRPVWSVNLPGTRVAPEPLPASFLGHPPRSGVGEETKVEVLPPHRANQALRPMPPHPPRHGEVDRLAGPEGSLPAAADRRAILYVTLVGVWAGVTGLLLLWLAACQWHLIRLRHGSKAIAEGPAARTLARLASGRHVHPPRLLASPCVRSPFLTGVWHPAILLPMSWEADFDAETLQVVLAHELAHHVRRDCAWTLLLRLTCAALWMQPLLWLLARQLAQATEESCDLMALTPDCPPRRYADCLLSLAACVLPSPAERTLGAGVVPIRSSLGRRIQSILDRRNQAMSVLSSRVRLAVALGTAAVVIGGLSLVSASTPQSPTPAPPVPAIVGTWTLPDQETLTFLPDGRMQSHNPHGIDTDGVYTIAQNTLKVTTQRLVWRGQADQPLRTEKTAKTQSEAFTLAGDSLTLIFDSGHRVTARRATVGRTGRPIAISGTQGDGALAHAQFLAGLTPVQGPGVIVTLRDSRKKMPEGWPSGAAPPNVIHDTDIEAVVNELKAAGAEAIAINSERLIATSPIRVAGSTVFVNNTAEAPPFVIKAIGNPDVLAQAINRPHGVISQISLFDPAMVRSERASLMTLPAYQGSVQDRYARPVPTATGSGGKSSAPGGPLRRFSIMWRAPRTGTHHLQIFAHDQTGQRLVFDRTCRAGQSVAANVTAVGSSVDFLLYDNGRISSEKRFSQQAYEHWTPLNFHGDTRGLVTWKRPSEAARRSNLSGLERQRDQALIQLKVAQKSAETYHKLAVSAGPVTVIELDPLSRPRFRQLQELIAAAQAEVDQLARNHSPQDPLRLQALARLDALKQERNALLKQPYITSRPNPEYPTLLAQADAARAEAARAEVTIDVLDAQIQKLK